MKAGLVSSETPYTLWEFRKKEKRWSCANVTRKQR